MSLYEPKQDYLWGSLDIDMTPSEAREFNFLTDLPYNDDDFEDIEQYCAIDDQIEAIKRGWAD